MRPRQALGKKAYVLNGECRVATLSEGRLQLILAFAGLIVLVDEAREAEACGLPLPHADFIFEVSKDSVYYLTFLHVSSAVSSLCPRTSTMLFYVSETINLPVHYC